MQSYRSACLHFVKIQVSFLKLRTLNNEHACTHCINVPDSSDIYKSTEGGNLTSLQITSRLNGL